LILRRAGDARQGENAASERAARPSVTIGGGSQTDLGRIYRGHVEDMPDAPKENLDKLHKHEEQLRAESLALITKRAELTDHWKLVQEAMNVVYAFANDHVHGSDDELTMQFLGIRLFGRGGRVNQIGTLGLLSEGEETYFLVDYLRSNPV
jgi:hypothetical protein